MSNNELHPPPIDSSIPTPTVAKPPAQSATVNSPQGTTGTVEASSASKASASNSTATTATITSKSTAISSLVAQPVVGTFLERLQKALLGTYYPSMRRSVQTCVLFEADRCLNMQYKRLKPFQRKVALHDTASDIVETLTFIPPHYRIEIMYRTNTKKELLTPEFSWRRMRMIDRDIKVR